MEKKSPAQNYGPQANVQYEAFLVGITAEPTHLQVTPEVTTVQVDKASSRHAAAALSIHSYCLPGSGAVAVLFNCPSLPPWVSMGFAQAVDKYVALGHLRRSYTASSR